MAGTDGENRRGSEHAEIAEVEKEVVPGLGIRLSPGPPTSLSPLRPLRALPLSGSLPKNRPVGARAARKRHPSIPRNRDTSTAGRKFVPRSQGEAGCTRQNRGSGFGGPGRSPARTSRTTWRSVRRSRTRNEVPARRTSAPPAMYHQQSQGDCFASRSGGALDISLGLRPNPEFAPATSLVHRLHET